MAKFKITMTTVTIKINERSRLGKAIMELLRSSAKESKTVEFVEESKKSPYNPEFVKMVKNAEKRGEYTEIDPKNVWASIGL